MIEVKEIKPQANGVGAQEEGKSLYEIKCEWSNMMTLQLETKTVGRFVEAQVVAFYNDEKVEGGWITVDDPDDIDSMVTQALMVYWVNSEVVGTGRN
jgi:hypothetical protein